MSENIDYYQVLGIKRNATPEEVKEAYLYWVNVLHPDRMLKMPEHVRMKAQDDLKKVNEAYSVLSDLKMRAQYDRKMYTSVDTKTSSYQQARAKVEPRAEVYPKIIFLDSTKPRAKQRGTFFIRNVGGECSKILISNPEKWIKIIKTKSLYPDKKLPMQVDIEAIAPDRGKTIRSEIKVRLDQIETSVKIELYTRKKR